MAKPRRRHRWQVAVAAVVVPVAAAVAGTAATAPDVRAAEPLAPAGQAEVVAVRAADPTADGDAGTAQLAGPPAHSVVLSASRSVRRPLPAGVAPEAGLQVKTILAARAISAAFPEVTTIGGVRADALKWHPNGLAIDVMIPDWNTAAGKSLGDEVVAFTLANKERFGLNHVIWRQIIWSRDTSAHVMNHYGSADADHFTHVHVATDGGGYPTGGETYYR